MATAMDMDTQTFIVKRAGKTQKKPWIYS
jgi:hypothetical protein